MAVSCQKRSGCKVFGSGSDGGAGVRSLFSAVSFFWPFGAVRAYVTRALLYSTFIATLKNAELLRIMTFAMIPPSANTLDAA